LLDYLHSYGKTLNYAATGFSGISVAGALATGVHGSNAQGHANIANEIQALWVVGANGSLNYYSKGTTGITDSEKWKALTTNLGLLGPVVKLSMKIRDDFHMHTKIFYHSEANLLAPNGLANIVAGCKFSFISWFPGADTGSLTNTCGWETTEPVSQENTKMALFTPDIDPALQGVFITASQLDACPNTDIFSNVIYPLNYATMRGFEVTRADFNNDPANGWIWLDGAGARGRRPRL
jgi:FAD/FMN-containing dehydrogenase